MVNLRDRIREEGDAVKISALEEFNSKYVRAINYVKKSTTYEGEPISVLLLQLDSDDEDALLRSAADIVDIVEPYDKVDIFEAKDAKTAELYWEDRHKLSAISKRTSGFKVNEDVVIPLNVVPEFADFLENLNLHYMRQVARLAEEAGLCSAQAFLKAASDPELLKKYAIPAETAEGFLFPDTYLFTRKRADDGTYVVETMMMGRKRSLAALRAASSRDLPSLYCSTANSTMRMAFLAARPISVTRAIWK